MSVKLVREVHGPKMSKERKHRQRYFWNQGRSARIEHIYNCASCQEWLFKSRNGAYSNVLR